MGACGVLALSIVFSVVVNGKEKAEPEQPVQKTIQAKLQVFNFEEALKNSDLVVKVEVEKKTRELLTERELEILIMATKGMSNQEIADELFLSLRTVQAHFGHIFNKLQVGSRTEAVVHALKEGWISLDKIS